MIIFRTLIFLFLFDSKQYEYPSSNDVFHEGFNREECEQPLLSQATTGDISEELVSMGAA